MNSKWEGRARTNVSAVTLCATRAPTHAVSRVSRGRIALLRQGRSLTSSPCLSWMPAPERRLCAPPRLRSLADDRTHPHQAKSSLPYALRLDRNRLARSFGDHSLGSVQCLKKCSSIAIAGGATCASPSRAMRSKAVLRSAAASACWANGPAQCATLSSRNPRTPAHHPCRTEGAHQALSLCRCLPPLAGASMR